MTFAPAKMKRAEQERQLLPALTTSFLRTKESIMAESQPTRDPAPSQLNESPALTPKPCKRNKWRFKHGLCHTSEYRAWQCMRLRCFNPENEAYPDYGGRGITVCDRWKDDFLAFLADMGPKPGPEYELDRIDNDGNYEPGNCRWATRSENDRNRRSNRWVEFKGERCLLIELCEQFEIRYDTVTWRLDGGWGLEKALTTPARVKRANGVLAAEKAAHVPVRPRIDAERTQKVIDLFIAGNTYEQIVAATDVSYNTVGRIIKRAGAKR